MAQYSDEAFFARKRAEGRETSSAYPILEFGTAPLLLGLRPPCPSRRSPASSSRREISATGRSSIDLGLGAADLASSYEDDANDGASLCDFPPPPGPIFFPRPPPDPARFGVSFISTSAPCRQPPAIGISVLFVVGPALVPRAPLQPKSERAREGGASRGRVTSRREGSAADTAGRG